MVGAFGWLGGVAVGLLGGGGGRCGVGRWAVVGGMLVGLGGGGISLVGTERAAWGGSGSRLRFGLAVAAVDMAVLEEAAAGWARAQRVSSSAGVELAMAVVTRRWHGRLRPLQWQRHLRPLSPLRMAVRRLAASVVFARLCSA